MKIGINTLLWTAQFGLSDLPILDRMHQAGFDGVEIASFDFTDFPASEIGGHARSLGLGLTGCTAFTGDQSFMTDDPDIRSRTFRHIRLAIEKTAEMGAQILVGPFVSAVGFLPGRRRTSDEWSRAAESLASLGPLLERTGVTLAVEPLNRFETFALNTAADAAELCEAVNHTMIGVLYDTFHANIEERDIAAGCARLGRHLKHVHTCENDRGAPGSGHVEWDSLLATLREMGYDGWLVIESFGSRVPEIATAACIWRDLAPSAHQLAEDGLAFLRGKTAGGSAS